MNKICALIPTYNHYTRLPDTVSRLLETGLAVFIVDDGSNAATQQALQQLLTTYPAIKILHLPKNTGKGGAIQAGLNWVAQAGYSHAFQIDADGQHSLDTLEDFLLLADANSQALISGQPHYDASIPWSRRIGRWFTHVWVFIETLSFRIRDSMCGFRIYPIPVTLAIINQYAIGKRMDFDTEILVRLFWQGTPVIMRPLRVTYPADNTSNFDVVADNWRITKMHTRLFFLMLWRLPHILRHRPDYKNIKLLKESTLWSNLEERGTLYGLWLLAMCYRLLGRSICLVIGAPVVLYFYLTGSVQRHASQAFLQHIWSLKKLPRPPGMTDSVRHFMNFFAMALDKFAAWTGHLQAQQIDHSSLLSFDKLMTLGTGGVLLVSHLGNMEFCRAVADQDHKQRVHVLWHSKNSQRFNRMLKFFNPHANINLIEVTEVGPDTILYLKERVEQGDWIVIAADRVPVSDNQRIVTVPFLGKDAPFSQGPYILAALLQCPVYTAVAVNVGKQYHVYLELLATKIAWERKNRLTTIQQYAQLYAARLESYCLQYPYQWFNFFDFWQT